MFLRADTRGGVRWQLLLTHLLLTQLLLIQLLPIHIPQVALDANWFCAENANGFVYTLTEHNLMPFYLQVLEGKYAHLGLRVLVYNGDTDPSINSLAGMCVCVAAGMFVYVAAHDCR